MDDEREGKLDKVMEEKSITTNSENTSPRDSIKLVILMAYSYLLYTILTFLHGT